LRNGADIKRTGAAPPPDLADWLSCEAMSFRVMPGDLEAGKTLDDQPWDTLTRYWKLVARYEREKERLQALRQRQVDAANRRRKR